MVGGGGFQSYVESSVSGLEFPAALSPAAGSLVPAVSAFLCVGVEGFCRSGRQRGVLRHALIPRVGVAAPVAWAAGAAISWSFALTPLPAAGVGSCGRWASCGVCMYFAFQTHPPASSWVAAGAAVS